MGSQAAIKALTSFRISAISVLGSIAAVEDALAHKGIESNEKVDEFSRCGLQRSSENLTYIGKAMYCVYHTINLDRSIARKVKTLWNELSGCQTAKVMCKAVDQKYTKWYLVEGTARNEL